MPSDPTRASTAHPHLLRAPGQYLRRHPGPDTDRITRALVDPATTAGGSRLPAAASARRSPTRIELPEHVDARLEQATRARGAAAVSKAGLIDQALRELLEHFAQRLEHPGPFTAPPPGRRVPRGQWTRPRPLRSLTVKFDPDLLEQARGFLVYCRAAAVDPARVDGITTLNELVAVAVERLLPEPLEP